jgi:hypothetical protein
MSIMTLEDTSVPFGCIMPATLMSCRAGSGKCRIFYCQIFCVSQQLTIMAMDLPFAESAPFFQKSNKM